MIKVLNTSCYKIKLFIFLKISSFEQFWIKIEINFLLDVVLSTHQQQQQQQQNSWKNKTEMFMGTLEFFFIRETIVVTAKMVSYCSIKAVL